MGRENAKNIQKTLFGGWGRYLKLGGGGGEGVGILRTLPKAPEKSLK